MTIKHEGHKIIHTPLFCRYEFLGKDYRLELLISRTTLNINFS